MHYETKEELNASVSLFNPMHNEKSMPRVVQRIMYDLDNSGH